MRSQVQLVKADFLLPQLHFSFLVSAWPQFCYPPVSGFMCISLCSHSSRYCCCSFPPHRPAAGDGLELLLPLASLLPAHTLLLRCSWLGHAFHPTPVLIHGVKNNGTACLLSATLPVLCCISGTNFPIFLYVQCLCRCVGHAVTTCVTNFAPSVTFFPCESPESDYSLLLPMGLSRGM